VLVPLMGPLGAARSTAVCYVEVWVIRLGQSRKYIRLRVRLGRDVASYLLLVVQSVALLLISEPLPMYGVVGGLFVVIALLYFRDLRLVASKLLHVVRR
jgi:O-antigen/teichoic acid export membrane protein